MSELMTQVRPLEVIEAELDLLERDTRQKETALIENYIEVGRRLEEVKAQLEHGQWGPWLEQRGYPQPKAIKLMKVFRAYGKDQQSLFGGEAKSKAFSNLGFQKLVQLLAIEDEAERERFVEEQNVEAMSTRELEKALKERDEALRQAEEAEKEADDAMKEAKAARAEASTAEEARAKMAADMKIVKESLKDRTADAHKYKAEANDLRIELRKMKAQPVEVAVEIREPTPEELEKLTADAVEKARAEDRERIASMEKKLAAADGDMAAFKVYYEAWQEDYNKMMGQYALICNKGHEKAGNLHNGILAVLEGWWRDATTDNR